MNTTKTNFERKMLHTMFQTTHPQAQEEPITPHSLVYVANIQGTHRKETKKIQAY